jgi:hypothetical protein
MPDEKRESNFPEEEKPKKNFLPLLTVLISILIFPLIMFVMIPCFEQMDRDLERYRERVAKEEKDDDGMGLLPWLPLFLR